MHEYSAFGLRIRSDRPVPGLANAGCGDSFDPRPLAVSWLEDAPLPGDRRTPDATIVYAGHPDRAGIAEVTAWQLGRGGDYIYEYRDGTSFRIRADGERVWAHWPPAMSIEDTATYLLGPIIAFVLRLRGVVTLHAGAVVVDGRALLLVGGPGAGKSTITSAFALRGNPILSDDIAIVTPAPPTGQGFVVHPAGPQLRLWNDSAATLFGEAESLPLLTPNWNKRGFDAGAHGVFSRQIAPLGAILVLDSEENPAADPWIDEMPPRAAFVAIVGNLHTPWDVPDTPRASVFDFATSIVDAVPVRRMRMSRRLDRLDQVCDTMTQFARDAGGHVHAR